MSFLLKICSLQDSSAVTYVSSLLSEHLTYFLSRRFLGPFSYIRKLACEKMMGYFPTKAVYPSVCQPLNTPL